MSRSLKMATLAAVVSLSSLGIFAGTAATAAPTITYPYLSPPSTAISATGTLSGSGTLFGVAFSANCTTVKTTADTPADGMTASVPSKDISITGCTDSLHGTDTVKVAGTWKLMLSKNSKTVTLTLPKDAAIFTSSIDTGCPVTFAPAKAAKITGTYNEKTGAASLPSQTVPTSAPTACDASSTGTVTSSLTLKPIVTVVTKA
jgi:hypothetical protein